MKFFSTLLNNRIPNNNIISVINQEYSIPFRLKNPDPVNASLKVSIIHVIGLISRINRYFSGVFDSGIMMEEMYIPSCNPKLTKKVKSLYLVVSDEIVNPIPIDNNAVCNTIIGMNRR
jgi:hypothetical protein